MAKRVMDKTIAGHILPSRHVAEDLAEYKRWREFLHNIGTFEVKHGVPVSVTNLYSDEVGNAKLPTKLQAVRKRRAHVRWARDWRGIPRAGRNYCRVRLFFCTDQHARP